MVELSLLGLSVIREVAARGSFSAAAERLGYTQSAVSRQVALTEQAVGRRLFERHARGVRLTAAGELLARRADTVLGEVSAARHELQELPARAPTRLRVGAFSSALAALVPRAIGDADVRLQEGTSDRLAARVDRGRLDIAVVSGDLGELLLDDPLLVAFPRDHPLGRRPSVHPRELVGERWIVGSTEPHTSLLGAWAARPTIAHVARDWTAKLGLVAGGHGITTVPGLALAGLPPSIAVARIDDPAAVRRVGVVLRPGAPVDAFVERLRDVAAQLATELRAALQGHAP